MYGFFSQNMLWSRNISASEDDQAELLENKATVVAGHG